MSFHEATLSCFNRTLQSESAFALLVNGTVRPRLPTPAKIGKFVCPLNSAGQPWVPPELYDHKADSRLIITEGPIKGMVLTMAGYDTVALNGVWWASAKRANELCNAGAEICQLTSWKVHEGKGIDDYLVAQSGNEHGAVIQALIDGARPFIQALSATVADAELVQKAGSDRVWSTSARSVG